MCVSSRSRGSADAIISGEVVKVERWKAEEDWCWSRVEVTFELLVVGQSHAYVLALALVLVLVLVLCTYLV